MIDDSFPATSVTGLGSGRPSQSKCTRSDWTWNAVVGATSEILCSSTDLYCGCTDLRRGTVSSIVLAECSLVL